MYFLISLPGLRVTVISVLEFDEVDVGFFCSQKHGYFEELYMNAVTFPGSSLQISLQLSVLVGFVLIRSLQQFIIVEQFETAVSNT